MKYSAASGKVVVAADEAEDGMIRFEVSDKGVGISPEGLRNLFVPFSRVADDRISQVTGSGLGLYICKNLVELHGGEMWIESEWASGTTVIFTMPGAARVVQPSTRPESAPSDLAVVAAAAPAGD